MQLNISTDVPTSCEEIARALLNNGVQSQVSMNSSTHLDTVEPGYCILLVDGVPEKEFKEKVWNVLQPMFNLCCAFVDSPYYKGCVLNWPVAFRDSACPSWITKNSLKPSDVVSNDSTALHRCTREGSYPVPPG